MSPGLPIKRMVLYKHGVGYFERRGPYSGESLRLSFPRTAMDDILKSLVAIDHGGGQVLGVDYETPEDRESLLQRGSIHLSDARSLLDLLRDLRGRRVRFRLQRSSADAELLEGLLIGVDLEDEQQLQRPLASIYLPEQRQVRSFAVASILQLDLLDEAAADDLSYFLRASQSEADRRAAELRLSPGEHDLLVGYLAPAPSWRVSYRLLLEPNQNGSEILLQGWGLFDNQLDEDLEAVRLTLVAGMPISFRYRLYEPHTPERPLIQDEERTVSAPVLFSAAPPPQPAAMPAPSADRRKLRAIAGTAMAADAEPEMALAEPGFGIASMESASSAIAVGGERGALFEYRVAHPITVARGRSAMVPIVSSRLSGRRELLYNGRKLPDHPVASLRTRNTTGLTLERGPVTVLEDGAYAGEAVVPFTRDGAELIVAFAVELGIKVIEQRQSERRIASIAVHGEFLLLQEYEILRTDYHLSSMLNQDALVLIEHPRSPHYELSDTPDPAESSVEFARWPVGCQAGRSSSFSVQERRLLSRREAWRKLGRDTLRSYLQARFLDQRTFEALQGVLDLYEQLQQNERQLKELEAERQRIYKQQSQVQGTLAPLGREGEEAALRRRYVGTLNELENRLGELATQERRLQEQARQLERQIEERIAALK